MSRESLADAVYCHAVLARCVEDPGRLPSLDDEPPRAEIDLLRLRQMAGLITKVRHNPVRFSLPLTMRALGAAGLEIDFFADYAPRFSARRREGFSDGERTTLFVSALRQWLQPSDDGHQLVADVLAHELLMIRLADQDPVPPPDAGAVVSVESRPRLRDGVHLLHLTVHPPDVADLAEAGAGPCAIDRTPRCYAYIPTPAGTRVKCVAQHLAPLLDMADGAVTIAQMADALRLESAVDDLVAVFQVMIRQGLADIERQ